MKERTINLRKMFWDVVLSWRSIIVCGIVGALLFGMLYYVKNRGNAENTDVSQGVEISTAEFTPEELEDVNLVLNMYNRLNAYQNCIDNSLLMQTPVSDIHKLSVIYYVDAFKDNVLPTEGTQALYGINISEEKQESSIMALYTYALSDVAVLEEISRAAHLDVSDIQELMDIKYTENILCITVLYTENMDIDNMTQVINDFILEQDYTDIVDYDISYVGEIYEQPVYTELLDSNQKRLSDLYNMRDEYRKQVDKLSGQQQKYVESVILAEKQQGDTPADDDTDEASSITHYISKKYILIGFCLGILFVCFWVVCRTVFSSVLSDEEHIGELYNVRVFGVIVTPSRRRFLAKIDDMFIGIKDRRKKKLTDEQKYTAAISSVVLECEQKKIKKICVTGTEIEHISDDILSRFREDLKKSGIEVQMTENVVYDGESLKNCVGVGSVIILEQLGKSLYGEINSEIKKMNEYDVCILGALILN